jgi:hypothetical protein
MKRYLMAFFTIAMVFWSACTMAADDQAQICALTKAFECANDSGCNEVTIDDMGLPRFVRIDQKAKTIESLDKGVNRQSTKIATITRLEGLTILQGIEKRGWSIALGDDSRDLMLSAVGEGSGFVVFGSCMKP